jgi:hypothetical protein
MTSANAAIAAIRARTYVERDTPAANLVPPPLSSVARGYGGYPYRAAHTMAAWMAPPTPTPTGSAERTA